MAVITAEAMIIMLFAAGAWLIWKKAASAVRRRVRLRRKLVRKGARTSSRRSALLPLCMLLFAAVFLSALRYCSLLQSGLIAFLAAAIPILAFAAAQGRAKRLAGTEGLSLVSELLRQYRAGSRNIYDAMEGCLESGADLRASRKQLSLLLIRLREAGSRDAVSAACARFSASIGTSWAAMLSSCVETAVLKGADISEGLSDIAEQLKESRKLLEERKRMNSEAVRMSVFLVPALYGGTMLICSGFLGMEVRDILRNQFASAAGITLFLISVFLFLFNVVVLQAVESSGRDL